ncbi:DUF6527 family protein [Sphingomonas crusticola]|uniref:DUF6527 family protein n=1 Tax=Sphingomonas crusticola TaxID=1697973 RepID=UPI000E2556FD|nr:DUF6527 family protein [Sphingomonas crusticola]
MIGSLLRRVRFWLSGWFRPAPPARYALAYVDSDELPSVIPDRTVVVAREAGELWSAGLICPCGCGRRIELMLLPKVKPRWDIRESQNERPTLWPSIWANDGCRSHFWLRDGMVEWCKD